VQFHVTCRFARFVAPALAVAVVAAVGGASPAVASSAASRCPSSKLHVRLTGGVAAGSIGDTVTFRNASGTTCTLRGYPGLQMLSATGRALATHLHRGAAVTVPAVPTRTVTLTSGSEASFYLGYPDATGYALLKCPTSASVEITPPNATKPITVPWHLQPYGGTTQHLRCGIITVSPVFAGH
jgi:hypothetical protein